MRLLTLLLILLMSAPAAAEWVKYAETNTETHFFDPATVKVSAYFTHSAAAGADISSIRSSVRRRMAVD